MAGMMTVCPHATQPRFSRSGFLRSFNSKPACRRIITPRSQLLPDFQIDTVNATYVALGSSGLAFLGTFFIIPQFKDSFKEELTWREIHGGLVEQGVKSIAPAEALAKSKKGAVLLDVRMRGRFDNAAKAANSINVPLYQPIQNWDIASNLRRAGFAFFGVYGTELNEGFLRDVQDLIPTSKEVIVMCDNGGTIKTKVGANYGFQSRSLKAVYFLQQAGYKKVYHLEGGLSQWFREGLPESDVDGDENDAAPNPLELVGVKFRK